ncbi:hypothetical protein, partial [Klebsiella quasipneumoniae]|uniref:hypothetical protein n=1 Tax=Klebsiella quasipneumoniae TaxID=1463165 RepID=UPI0021698026
MPLHFTAPGAAKIISADKPARIFRFNKNLIFRATVLNTTSLTGQIMESIVPFLTFFDHGIDDSKQFSHRGDQG